MSRREFLQSRRNRRGERVVYLDEKNARRCPGRRFERGRHGDSDWWTRVWKLRSPCQSKAVASYVPPAQPQNGLALLETQGVDRIERCGAPGGIKPEADPDSGANNQSRDGPAKRKNEIGLKPRR